MSNVTTILGQDHGYMYFKDSNKHIFNAAYSRINNTLSNKYEIIIDNEVYYFNGDMFTADKDKIESEHNKVATLYDCAINNIDECFLVVGLPISQYNNKKDKLIQTIMNYNNCNIVYQNKEFKPNIKDVTVFAQGVGAIYNIGLEDGLYISFDIGSYTINVVMVEIKKGIPYIKKYDTWFDGILKLFMLIREKVLVLCDYELSNKEIEDIFKTGKFILYGEMKDVKIFKSILRDYLENIFTKFKPNYPYATTPILLSGGGSILLGQFFIKCFPNSLVLPDPQFANAIGYYKFGLQKYEQYLEGVYQYA